MIIKVKMRIFFMIEIILKVYLDSFCKKFIIDKSKEEEMKIK